MKNGKTVLALLILLTTSCTSLQKQTNTNTVQKTASYEKDVYPFIVDQLNNTASTFFYDIERGNKVLKDKGIYVAENDESSENAIVGNNEIPGICSDYAFHFIDNYKGPGVVFYLSFSKGKALLERIVKPFEKNDIIIHDKKTTDSYINDEYQAERNREKEEQLNYYYDDILQILKNSIELERFIIRPAPHPHWSFDVFHLLVKDGKPFLTENIDIPTPESHVGGTTEEFSEHAWVRILWNRMTIDVDPTWYDNGFSLEEVIEIK